MRYINRQCIFKFKKSVEWMTNLFTHILNCKDTKNELKKYVKEYRPYYHETYFKHSAATVIKF